MTFEQQQQYFQSVAGAAANILRNIIGKMINTFTIREPEAAFIENEWRGNMQSALQTVFQKVNPNEMNEQVLTTIMMNFVDAARRRYAEASRMQGGGVYYTPAMQGSWQSPPYGGGQILQPQFTEPSYTGNISFNPGVNVSTGTRGYVPKIENTVRPVENIPTERKAQQSEINIFKEKENKPMYQIPVKRDNISTDILETEYGTLKTHHLIDPADNDLLDVVRGSISKGFVSPMHAVQYVRQVCKQLASKMMIILKYSQLKVVNIPIDDMRKILSDLKELTKTSNCNDVRYLEDIRKNIYQYSKGTADAIEQFFVDEFNAQSVAGALCDSDVTDPRKYSIRMGSLKDILDSVNSNSEDPVIRNMQQIKGFRERVFSVGKEAILNMISDIEICDPNSPDGLNDIVTACPDVYLADETTKNHQIYLSSIQTLQMQVLNMSSDPSKKEACDRKAKRLERLKNEIKSFTVFKIHRKNLFFTTLSFNDPVLDEARKMKIEATSVGGEPENHLEYLLMKMKTDNTVENSGEAQTAASFPAYLIIQPVSNVVLSYFSTITTDNWIRLFPCKLM